MALLFYAKFLLADSSYQLPKNMTSAVSNQLNINESNCYKVE